MNQQVSLSNGNTKNSSVEISVTTELALVILYGSDSTTAKDKSFKNSGRMRLIALMSMRRRRRRIQQH